MNLARKIGRLHKAAPRRAANQNCQLRRKFHVIHGDSAGDKLKAQLEKCCASELHNKNLQIHLLPSNKSSEDIFTNLDILKKAIRKAYDKLINDGIRTLKEGCDVDKEITGIAESTTSTLGKTLDKTTQNLFNPKDKISKLLIASMYEDLREEDIQPLPGAAAVELEKIKQLLNLRGEKSKEAGVFEEVH